METLKVSMYAGLLLALPLILSQVSAFVLPALSPREKQVALPAMLGIIPVAIVAATRAEIVSTAQLARNRRYAVLATAVLAMVLPGQDPITMLLLMAPMYALFEASIVVSWLLDRRARRAFVSASNAAS